MAIIDTPRWAQGVKKQPFIVRAYDGKILYNLNLIENMIDTVDTKCLIPGKYKKPKLRSEYNVEEWILERGETILVLTRNGYFYGYLDPSTTEYQTILRHMRDDDIKIRARVCRLIGYQNIETGSCLTKGRVCWRHIL
jgi:hypothetical protein